MSKKSLFFTPIPAKLQRRIAKMGRIASGAGKTMRSTKNSKQIGHITG
ncbi:MAG TPA: hypothetical protein VFX17_02045 [Patescibacteria group bacterium]|nr:hypothetical protein [Patescibacteria group bacterium]